MKRSLAVLAALAIGVGAHRPGPVEPGSEGRMVEANGPDCNGVRVERTAWLMGTSLRANVCAPGREVGLEAIERAFEAVREVEARLSTWRADSELSRLNQAEAGTWTAVSVATARELREARQIGSETDGAFDPAVGAAVEAWDLRGAGRVPAIEEVEAAVRAAGPEAWEIDVPGARARRRAGVRLDAGGFGKGAGLRSASEALEAAGLEWSVLDFGGQMVLWSRRPGVRWSVAVADPRDRNEAAIMLEVGSGSIATTSASERFIETDDGRFGHVIDPRAGRPAEAWGSVTVVAADPLRADALSTALFVMGGEDALAWSEEAGAAVLVLRPEGSRLVRHASRKLEATASIETIIKHGRGSRT